MLKYFAYEIQCKLLINHFNYIFQSIFFFCIGNYINKNVTNSLLNALRFDFNKNENPSYHHTIHTIYVYCIEIMNIFISQSIFSTNNRCVCEFFVAVVLLLCVYTLRFSLQSIIFYVVLHQQHRQHLANKTHARAIASRLSPFCRLITTVGWCCCCCCCGCYIRILQGAVGTYLSYLLSVTKRIILCHHFLL